MKVEHVELQNHLNKIAEKNREDGSCLVLCTDLEHWISNDVNSVDELEHTLAQACHYDFYKEIHGIKPRWILYSKMTTEEINKDIKSLEAEYDQMIIQEKEEKEAYSRMVQARKKRNSYKPNLVFSGLKEMM